MRAPLVIAPSLRALGGGVEQQARHLVGALERLWPESRVRLVLAREQVGRLDRFRLGRAARMIANALAAPAELVVCQHLSYAPLGVVVARLRSAPLVVIAHGIEAWQVPSPIVRAAVRAADRVIAVSRVTAERVQAACGVSPHRVRVVNNPVDVARFRPGPVPAALVERLRPQGSSPARPRLLTVARLEAHEAYKGVDLVIEALAGLPAQTRPGYLVVGEGSDRPRLEALARSRGVAVTFWGRATDEELPGLYRAADLFVMPSRNEGFGYVFLEALASGVPVIAGDRDGSVDALDGGKLGALVDPTDPAAVRAAISAQLARPRDPEALHAAVAARFGLPAFDRALGAALDGLSAGYSARKKRS